MLSSMSLLWKSGSRSLRACGLVNGPYDGVKILGEGDLSKKLTISVNKISASAKEKVEKAGGSVAAV